MIIFNQQLKQEDKLTRSSATTWRSYHRRPSSWTFDLYLPARQCRESSRLFPPRSQRTRVPWWWFSQELLWIDSPTWLSLEEANKKNWNWNSIFFSSRLRRLFHLHFLFSSAVFGFGGGVGWINRLGVWWSFLRDVNARCGAGVISFFS